MIKREKRGKRRENREREKWSETCKGKTKERDIGIERARGIGEERNKDRIGERECRDAKREREKGR